METPDAVPTTSPMRLAIAATPRNAADTAPASRHGLVDRDQAEHEARAKAMWGDSKEQVTAYLKIQGYARPEATEQGRRAQIRAWRLRRPMR